MLKSSSEFRVAVIIPVFNAEKFIEKAVRSAVILKEVGEVIIVDDGSTDNSYNICIKLRSSYSKIKVFQHQNAENKGVSASRNLGIKKAAFNYISFLDADDYYLPNRFDRDKIILINEKHIDGVYNALGIEYYTQKGKDVFLKSGYKYQEFLTVEKPVEPHELPLVLLNHHEVKGEFHGNCITVRKALFEKTGVFNTSLRLKEDIHLWLRMALIGQLKSGILDQPVAIRGVHDNNTMVKHYIQPMAYMIWYKTLISWCRTNGIEKLYIDVLKINFLRYRVYSLPFIKSFPHFMLYMVNNPKLIVNEYGDFDLLFFKLFKHHNAAVRLISFKNKFFRKKK